MVLGIDVHLGGAQTSYFTTWLERIRNAAPMWQVTPWVMNTIHYLPQHRGRIYTVFTNKMSMVHPVPPPLPNPRDRCELVELLHPGLGRLQEHRLSPHLRDNLRKTLLQLGRRSPNQAHALAARSTRHGPVLVLELDRDPEATWGSVTRVDGAVPT